MKILQLVTKRQYRGAEVFAANLSEELIKLGHEIVFAGLYKNNDNILEVEDAENLDISEEKNTPLSLSLIRSLISIVKKTKPDIVQCNGSDTLKYMVAASYFLPKIPITYRNISTISEWMGSKVKLQLYKALFNRVAHVSSVGSGPREDLILTLNYPKSKTSVLRRGIPGEQKEIKLCAQNLRNELEFTQDTKIVMHVGNFSPEKNHRFLLDVFQKIAKDHEKIKLVCVGDGITYDKIQTEIQERKLGGIIHLLGFKKNIPELLAGADCVVLSSLIEGVPGIILEAAVQGKPCVASNVGGVKEVLIDKKTGYIIDDFDADVFADKIKQLCLNDQLRFKLGENAQKLVFKEFNPLKNAKKFEALYLKLIKES
ncbi:Glycosyltransferase involved in cell wall bisynthesis [Salegentibacter echinorum]|uniref:Glycosyltransferase involved in cell wall bisynthesis n=1 Tax=Salegentibacter echinorum TaxID=1073325 RepID=A0A1M5FJT1_SALEC|nr:glycosyltransferase [Salegentibacter echinorum]SHF91402.1 Glycosyltransferase involved in cell wall bisynthesis [Salegentibacter echinorum]